ncbi:MAG: type VI secretion system baseplate subunit TssE [Paracoccaceae bacterium]
MSEAGIHARREAVQPSLWDRLVDDLPGLAAETEARRAELEKEIGAERMARILAGGHRALEQEISLDPEERKAVHVLLTQLQRRTFLEGRSIVVTPDVLREAVRRDMEALFNTERTQSGFVATDIEWQTAETPGEVLAGFPEVRRSVLNYGVPSFSGRRASDFDASSLARELKEVVATFEPRFKRDTIRVTVNAGQGGDFRISVEAMLLMSPVPERMRLSTKIDLDNGDAKTVIEEV